MNAEKRKFPRVKKQIKIGYEFVKWNEKKLDRLKKPYYSKTFDISASGVGFHNLENTSAAVLKKLEKGKLKIRLAVYLYKNKDPLMTFARLIWKFSEEEEGHERMGFIFLDVPESFYIEVKNFVHDEIVTAKKRE
jgi:hypothetical protein